MNLREEVLNLSEENKKKYTYIVRQITDRFEKPITNGKEGTIHSAEPLRIGHVYWSNIITDDNFSGMYRVIKEKK